MNIGCPHCLTRYQLPESLMGPGGARVTCPRCRQVFLVSPGGDVSAPAIAPDSGAAPEAPVSPRRVAASAMPPPAPPPALAPSAPPPALAPSAPPPPLATSAPPPDAARAAEPAATPAGEAAPIEIARRIVAQLHESHGREIESAVARGRVFSEHGVRIVDAFDSYRRAVGKGAVAGPFREALYERWGIDLTPHWERHAR